MNRQTRDAVAFRRVINGFFPLLHGRNPKSACASARLSFMLANRHCGVVDRVAYKSRRQIIRRGEDAMSIRIVVASLLVVGAVGGWSVGARAETQSDRDACIPDVHAHCGEFIPNREAIIQCLKKKIRIISPACRRVMSRPYNPRASAN